MNRNDHQRGFTLTELLIVIAIIAVLAALLFPFLTSMRAKAQAVDATNRLRQCGTIVLQKASENNDLLLIHASGTSRDMHDLRLHGMVQEVVGKGDIGQIVYTPAYEKFAKGTWPVWGVNLDDNPDIRVEWERVWMERGGQQRYVEGLKIPRCDTPSRYPLLADSSDANGVPRARFANDNAHKFAMRYQQKGPIFFLDGSSRLVGQSEMGKYGITDAYLFKDSSKSDPTLVTASADSN